MSNCLVGVAGYVAEEIAFGVAFPFEVMNFRDRAQAEFGIGDDVFPTLVTEAEARARAILTERWDVVEQLPAAQLATVRVEGPALEATIGPPPV